MKTIQMTCFRVLEEIVGESTSCNYNLIILYRDEFSSDLIQDMNSEYDALWTTMTSNLDSKIAKYFKLAQDQADQMRDAGVFGEPDVLASLPRAMSKLKSQKKRQSVGSIKSSYSTSTNSSYATAVNPQKQ